MSFILRISLVALTVFTGCASPAADEDTQGSSDAIQTGTAFTSPIANGLYTDGTNFIRAERSVGSLPDLAVAVQWIQWSFPALFLDGAGAPTVASGHVEVSTRRAGYDPDQVLSITTAGKNLNVTVTWTSGKFGPTHMTLAPVTYDSLDRSFVAAGVDAVFSQQNTTESGADITVAGGGVPTTRVRFFWDDVGVQLTTTNACGLMKFHPGSGELFISQPTQTASSCPAFYALVANGGRTTATLVPR